MLTRAYSQEFASESNLLEFMNKTTQFKPAETSSDEEIFTQCVDFRRTLSMFQVCLPVSRSTCVLKWFMCVYERLSVEVIRTTITQHLFGRDAKPSELNSNLSRVCYSLQAHRLSKVRVALPPTGVPSVYGAVPSGLRPESYTVTGLPARCFPRTDVRCRQDSIPSA